MFVGEARYTVEDVSCLLTALDVTDEQILNLTVSKVHNLKCLKLCLEILLNRSEGLRFSTLAWSPILLLEIVNPENVEDLCGILCIILKIQNLDSCEEIVDCVKSLDYADKEKSLLYLQLLNSTIEGFKLGNSETFFKIVDCDFILSLYKIMLSTTRIEQNYFIVNILKFYMTENVTSRFNIIDTILSTKDLYTISCIIQELWEVVFPNLTDTFWYFIREVILNNEIQKKTAMNILKDYVKLICLKKTSMKMITPFIKNKIDKIDDFEKVWCNFFILMEVSDEKQLHLVAPSLVLVESIQNLHFGWVICLYKKLLNHMQSSIVYYTASYVLDSNMESVDNFKEFLGCLLRAVNKNDYSDHCRSFFEKFHEYTRKLEHKLYQVLLAESSKVNWVPLSAWLFYVNCINIKLKLDYSVLIEILTNLKKLPHKYIRDGCYDLLLKYCNALIDQYKIDFNTFVEIASIFNEYDPKYLDKIIEKNKSQIVEFHTKGLICKKIILLEKEEIGFKKIAVLLKMTDDEMITKMLFHIIMDEKINPETSDFIFMSVCRKKFNPNDIKYYLNKRLLNLKPEQNVEYLLKITDFLELEKEDSHRDSNALKKYVYILLNPGDFTTSEISLAFKLYNKYKDESVSKDVLPFWTKKMLATNEKLDFSISISYLNLLFFSLTNTKSEDDVYIAKLSNLVKTIVEHLFETQPENVLVILYENFEILIKTLRNYPELNEFLIYCFEQLKNFKSNEHYKVCLHHFLKIVFRNYKLINDPVWSKTFDTLTTNEHSALIFLNNVSILGTRKSYFANHLFKLTSFGECYTKDRRYEYDVCKEIFSTRGFLTKHQNPNTTETKVRLKALELCSDMSNLMSTGIHEHIDLHYKRYFPDSSDHLQWLRAVQIKLIMLSNTERRCPDGEFFSKTMSHLCKENHHQSVRQVLQWHLISISLLNDSYFNEICDKFVQHKSELSHATSLIPVLYHISMLKSEMYVEKVIEILMDCTMGANFKLRVYSQVVILKLINLRLKDSTYDKYRILQNTLNKVVNENLESIDNILQSMKEFINNFNPQRHYNLRTILVDIPKINNVTPTEWENVEKVLEINKECEKHILPTKFRKSRMKLIEKKQRKSEKLLNINGAPSNIQKKIVPWKPIEVEATKREYFTDLIVVTSLISSAANLGGLARTCEIYGVQKMIVHDRKIVNDKEFKSLSMSSESWLNILEVKTDDLVGYISKEKKSGYTVVGAEQTCESLKLDKYVFPEKCVLLLGNEKEGIPSNFLPYLDICIEVPQFGFVRSLNVHVAGATFIWEYVRQKLTK